MNTANPEPVSMMRSVRLRSVNGPEGRTRKGSMRLQPQSNDFSLVCRSHFSPCDVSLLQSSISTTCDPSAFYPPVTSMELRAVSALIWGVFTRSARRALEGRSALSLKQVPSYTKADIVETKSAESDTMHRFQVCGRNREVRSTDQHGQSQEQAHENADEEPLYPSPTAWDRLGAVVAGVIAAALTVAFYRSLPAAAMVALTAASLTTFFRRDARMRGRLLSEVQARYSDSQFIDIGSMTVHYLTAMPSNCSTPRCSVVLLHGFGAAARAYHDCMQPLADRVRGLVVAVDMPGFGLTSRPAKIGDYDPANMLSDVIAALKLKEQGPVVVLGHSLGGLATARFLCSTRSAVQADAAVLVAPAIQVQPVSDHAGCGSDSEKESKGRQSSFWSRVTLPSPARKQDVCSRADTVARCVGSVASRSLSWAESMAGMAARVAATAVPVGLVSALQATTPLVALCLRMAVYSKGFWRTGLAPAVLNSARLSEKIVEGYRRGAWVRGWETGLLNFVWFRVTGGKSVVALLRDAARHHSGGSQSLPAALAQAVAGQGGAVRGVEVRGEGRQGPAAAQSIPLLVVHGEEDQVIPSEMGRRLARATASEFVGIEQCGHCPMHECPEEFARIVARFVNKNLP